MEKFQDKAVDAVKEVKEVATHINEAAKEQFDKMSVPVPGWINTLARIE